MQPFFASCWHVSWAGWVLVNAAIFIKAWNNPSTGGFIIELRCDGYVQLLKPNLSKTPPWHPLPALAVSPWPAVTYVFTLRHTLSTPIPALDLLAMASITIVLHFPALYKAQHVHSVELIIAYTNAASPQCCVFAPCSINNCTHESFQSKLEPSTPVAFSVPVLMGNTVMRGMLWTQAPNLPNLLSAPSMSDCSGGVHIRSPSNK